MLEMYVDIYIYDGLYVSEVLPRRRKSLLFADSAVIPTGNSGAAFAFDISHVNIFISVWNLTVLM